MGFAARHEPIGRTITLPVPMRIEDVALRPLEAYPELPPTFRCSPLRADISVSACKSNFLNGSRVSCRGCAVGALNAGVSEREAIETINDKRADGHERAAAKGSLSCIRCLKSGMTNKRLIGKMRLVRNTVCVSCFNREREFVNGGVNSKGMPIRKWAGLRNATITVKTADGKRKIEDIGLRMDAFECGRFVERMMPGATLVKTIIGDEVIEQFSSWTPPPFSPWEPGMVRGEKPKKPTRTHIRRVSRRSSKPSSAIASSVDWDDWDTPLYGKPASDSHSDADGNGNARRNGWLPPMSEEDDATYRASFEGPALDPESIAAYWDLTADGLPEFIEWLTDGWPVFDIKPAEPSAPVADTSAAAEVAEPVSDAVCPVADAVSNPDPIADEDTESEWEGCSLTRGDETIYVTDYAREHGISDEAAAIALGMCDPEYADEPQAIDSTAKLESRLCAKRTNEPVPKKITGKALRKMQKREAREARAQQQPAAPSAPAAPSIKHTCRAFVHVLMSGKFAA